jgi:GT2 family glycosyltransferase
VFDPSREPRRRLLERLRRVEAFVDARRHVLDRRAPGNLVDRVRPLEGMRAAGRGRFHAGDAQAGLALPGGPFAPGYYLFVVHVLAAAARTHVHLEALPADTQPQQAPESFALAANRQRPVFRIVHLRDGAAALRLWPVDAPGDFELRSLRFFRVPAAFAQRRMRRRVAAVHGVFGAGQPPQHGSSRAAALAELERAYARTFPRTVSQGDYAVWCADVEAPDEAALTQRAHAALAGLTSRPLVSVLVPVCDPDPQHLRECLESVLHQRYPHVQLCVADDASINPAVRSLLETLAREDRRVRVVFRPERGHIARATNSALALAEGALVAFLDHDDRLTPSALLRMVQALDGQPSAVLAYSDEDKLDASGRRREPHFKPRYNPELLLAQNYIGHLVVARTAAVRAVGGLRVGYEGSQDHDLLLRLTDDVRAEQVVHVPHVLYHWREASGSTATATDAKPYAAMAGVRAVADALLRRGIGGEVTHAPGVPHGYRVLPSLPAKAPHLAIIMPTRDGGALLRRAVESVLGATQYPSFELVIVDNGSVTPETLSFLGAITQDLRVRVLRDDAPFNFSALNNRAVASTRAEVVALLNDDVEVLDGNWLGEMVSLALRPAVGCVGAKLLYPDHTVQHAGVILGIGGVAGHAHKRFPASHSGYFGRLQLTHALSAVTGACLVVRRAVFEEVGGLDEGLAVAFNDVDFCLRVRDAGFRNMYTPHAVLVHHESATRGSDMAPERRARFEGEVRFMHDRWGAALRDDPYYSPHLTRHHEDFSIAAAP